MAWSPISKYIEWWVRLNSPSWPFAAYKKFISLKKKTGLEQKILSKQLTQKVGRYNYTYIW
jgi:hypothetical protein